MIDFKSNPDEVPFLLLDRTLRQMRAAIQLELDAAKVKLTTDQWMLLMYVREGKTMSARQVGERTGKDAASVSRMIDLLVKQKLLKRESSSDDRRSSMIQVSKTGLVVLEKTKTIAASLRKRSLKGLTNAELEAFKKTLDKLYENSGGRLLV